MSQKWILIFFVLFLTFASFAPSLQNGFVDIDDEAYVVHNEGIRTFSLQSMYELFTHYIYRNYHPLTFVTFSVEYHFFGLEAFFYHLDNILLHVVDTLLVMGFVYLLTSHFYLALLTGLLFGIHPFQVESVAWISCRKNVLYALFYLLSLISYVMYVKKQSSKCYYFSLIFFLLSLLSKQLAVTLPFVLLAIDFYVKRALSDKKIWREKGPFFILSAIFGIVTIYFAQIAGGFPNIPLYSLSDKIFLSTYALCLYVIKSVFPFELSCMYPFISKTNGFYPWTVYLSLPLLLALSVCIIKSQSRLLIFGFIFFFINIFITLNVVAMYDSLMYDRYFYIPSIGIFMIMAYLLTKVSEATTQKSLFIKGVFLFILLVYIFYLFGFSYKRCFVWKNAETLWSDVIKKYPQFSTAYVQRGAYYFQSGKMDLAFADIQKAIESYPRNKFAYFIRGQMHASLNQPKKAFEDFLKALEISPRYVDAYLERANIYFQRKEYQQAIADYNKAVELEPTNIYAYNNRGNSYLLNGQPESALEDYSKAIVLEPRYTSAYVNRGMAYIKLGDYRRALDDFNKALSLEGSNSIARRKKIELDKELLK